jgi:amidase
MCTSRVFALTLVLALINASVGASQQSPVRFHLQEATISQIQQAIVNRQITTVNLVELYLKRITPTTVGA